MNKKILLTLTLVILIASNNLFCPTVGSGSAASTQQIAFFPQADSGDSNINVSVTEISNLVKSEIENIMIGFAAFDNGIILENKETVCLFDSFFPISGNFVLNGGVIFLNRDLRLRSPLQLGVGRIAGDFFSIEFPGNISNLEIPTSAHARILLLQDQVLIGDNVNSVDWSFDDKYISMVSNTANGLNELQVFLVQDNTLTLTASYDFGNRNVQAVRWHPSEYFLATGQTGDTELRIFKWEPSIGQLTLTDSTGNDRINAVAWHPSGNYIAAGLNTNNTFYIYEISNGLVGTAHTFTLEGSISVQANALDWNSTGSYIAAGFNGHLSGTEIKVFHFDGATITLNAEVETGSRVQATEWLTDTVLVTGQSSGSERLRVFAHNSIQGTLTEKTSAQVGESKTVYGISTSNGDFVALVTDNNNNGQEVKIFSYNPTTEKLSLVTGYSNNVRTISTRFSHVGNHLLSGDNADYFCLFSFLADSLTFNNTQLFFNSDVTFNVPIKFEGFCLLNSGGHVINIGDSGSLEIQNSSTLQIEQAIVRGISGTNIACKDNTGTLQLKDLVWTQENDYTFSLGKIDFLNEVLMTAIDSEFSFITTQTCTFFPKSRVIFDFGFTFSYAPLSNDPLLLNFKNENAVLLLSGGVFYAGNSGIKLTKGSMNITNDSTFISEIDSLYGIMIGNGSIADDFKCRVLSGSTLSLQGDFQFNNVSKSFNLLSPTSIIDVGSNSKIKLLQDMNIEKGVISSQVGAKLEKLSGTRIIGSTNGFSTINIIS